MPTILRRLSAVPLGVFYGGSFVNGIDKGLAYVTESSGYSLSQWPAVEFSTYLVATMLMGFFSSYSSRSALIGIIASGIGASIVYFLPQETLFLPANYWSASALILSVPGTLYGRSLPLPMEDLPTGRLLGVDWKHWLWLWLPWQYVIADSVWLGTPAFMLLGKEVTVFRTITDLVKSTMCLGFLAYATTKALNSIRADSPFTRLQSVGMFLLWSSVMPIVANLWRLFF